MKLLLNIFSGMLILGGGIFFLQGLNILLGSFMSGDPRWAVIGGALLTIGIILLLWINRRR